VNPSDAPQPSQTPNAPDDQRAPEDHCAPDDRRAPWVELRSAREHTFIFDQMIGKTSPDARPGDIVTVYDRRGALFGSALYNPKSRIALRMFNFDDAPIDEAFFKNRIQSAVDLREKILRLPEHTQAYRLIHAEADGLSGLIVDRYDDTLGVEVFSLGMYNLLDTMIPLIHAAAGTTHHVAMADDLAAKREGFTPRRLESEHLHRTLKITEHGVRFKLRFDGAHKTGFFCDQRENRLRLTRYTAGADVLDLCSYSGGFGLYAMTIGNAKAVTCVDLDEYAIALAKENANLNQVKIDTVQADAFTYMRQMSANHRQFDVVVLDPPKLVFGKLNTDEGKAKYADLNRIAAPLVKPGGILLTCSCSGAVTPQDFLHWTTSAIRRAGRQSQILESTGPGPDHPTIPLCPETQYLKALFLRIL
jgi:23S rRNA (cytosine1962-C5)-methyltransferase